MLDFTRRLPLSRHAIDRDDAARGAPGLVTELLGDAATRILALHRGEAPCRRAANDSLSLALLSPGELPGNVDLDTAVYLGRTLAPRPAGEPAGTRIVSLSIDDHQREVLDAADPSWSWRGLRDVGIDLDELDAGAFTEALAMSWWHESHGFAPTTGEPTRSEHGGWVRRPVSGSGATLFPRTDAAVICAVVDRDDRLLLGANVNWVPRRYSLLAGFVEPGESFEAAVVREVFEESGARVVRPRYLGSQPWPFPASIMVGFIAELDPEQDPASVRPDQYEIADLRWFTREEIARESHLLPSRVSIARAIIEEWFGGPIDG